MLDVKYVAYNWTDIIWTRQLSLDHDAISGPDSQKTSHRTRTHGARPGARPLRCCTGARNWARAPPPKEGARAPSRRQTSLHWLPGSGAHIEKLDAGSWKLALCPSVAPRQKAVASSFTQAKHHSTKTAASKVTELQYIVTLWEQTYMFKRHLV